jgi:hypothetical protein
MKQTVYLLIANLISTISFGQTPEDIEKLGNLINDAVFFTRLYVTPATDASVYQASSAWVNSPKKQELWNFTLGIHGNVFFVPKSNQSFTVNNSDFKFFSLPTSNPTQLQTALGNDNQVPLTGTLAGQQVVIKSPEGINSNTAKYFYLQTTLAIWKGTDFILKFSPVVRINKLRYQIFGGGLKHNLDQYFKKLQDKKINLSIFAGYGREDLSIGFLDAQTSYGNLGLNGLQSLIDTYQLQFNASKEFGKFEIMTGIIFNRSNFNYKLNGEKGTIENTIPVQGILNEKLKELSDTKNNLLAEVSARYHLKQLYIQSVFGIGKFINSNLSVQYQFN